MPEDREPPSPSARRPSAQRALLAVVAAGIVIVAASSSPGSTPTVRADVAASASASQPPSHRLGAGPPAQGALALRAGLPPDTFSQAGSSLQHRTIVAGGIRRTYLVARSQAAGTGVLPVLVVLHGRTMSPEGIAQVSGFLPIAGRAVVVYPAGIGQSWNAGGCCGAASAESVDDASFIAAVVHDVLTTERGTSARSVFLAGYSNGGRMAYRMACQTPGLFAGIAAVEAVPVDTCPATHLSVPFLTIASTADPLLRITPNSPAKKVDGHPQPDVVGVVAQWRRREGCTPHAQVTVTGAVTRTVWPDCTRHSQIGFSLYRDTGHAWPAGGPRTPSAQAQILDFFRHVASGAFPPAAGR